jgi:small basic protein (TIGR04137 family)
MSVDRSLKIKGALTRHRNVLSRAERIEVLEEEQRWTQEDSVFGLPKVAHRKSHAGKKAKEEKPAEGVTAEAGAAEAEAAPTGAATPKAGAATPRAGAMAPKTSQEKPAKK